MAKSIIDIVKIDEVAVSLGGRSKSVIMEKGFTLIELLVVISIISLLSSVVFSSLNGARLKARDTKRLADIRQFQIALDLYYDKYGFYPSSDGAGCGGWDTPGNGTFITPLVTEGFLTRHLTDPVAGKDGGCSNFQYYRYTAGEYGCPATRGAYYVLMITDLETSGNPAPTSPGWNCPLRNWQPESDWVTGKFEN